LKVELVEEEPPFRWSPEVDASVATGKELKDAEDEGLPRLQQLPR